MKNFAIACFIAAVIVFVVTALSTSPKYVYPVRENIHNNGQVMTWDQYCYREYSNGKIDKEFLGKYRFAATVTNDTSFTFTQCSD